MTTDELIQLTDEYADLLATKQEIDSQMSITKNNIVEELEKVNDDKFSFPSLTAKKSTRKGNVDMKALQIKYNISDADLDELRNPSTSSWTLSRPR